MASSMICEVIPCDMWEKIELHDAGNKESGGVSFFGETLADFIGDCGLSPYDSYDALKEAMMDCDVRIEFKYIARHGVSSGSLPEDVTVIHSRKLSRLRDLVILDRPLSYMEKTYYDLSEVA